MKKNSIIEIIAILFVILFLYSGISKLMEYSVFKEQIAVSPILKPFAKLIAWALPTMEFVVAISLFIPSTRKKGLYASLGLMTIFTIYIIGIMIFDDHLPCSCGGVIELLSWKGHLIFNAVWIGLALIGIMLDRASRKSAILNSAISIN